MKVKFFALICIVSLFCFSCTYLEDVLGWLDENTSNDPFTNADAIEAMKSALNIGAEAASEELSVQNTGYFVRSKENGYIGDAALKILLPEEASNVLNNLDKIIEKVPVVDDDLIKEYVDKVVLGLNRTAEDSAKKATPIFANAIKEMTVEDGIKIICGEENAATEYLKENTYDDLLELYSTEIDASLDKSLIGSMSTNEAWNKLQDLYNTAVNKYNDVISSNIITGALLDKLQPLDVDISQFATEKALDGLFYMVEQEEFKIRENPLSYSSDIIQKVFGAVKEGFIPNN